MRHERRGAGDSGASGGRAVSRRDAFKAAAAVAAASLLPRAAHAQGGAAVGDAGTLEREWRQPPATNRPILLRGGTIVSLDPKVGDFARGDVLIDGKKIAGVGDQVKAPPQAQVIDATNTILIPGFVDAHRHSWEGQLRRIIPDGAIAEYMATTHNGFARHYRPHDIYVGNLITALGCIDAGITCVIDNSHNSRSAAHSDAAVQALIDSGIRGVHASGAPAAGTWDRQWPQDLERLQKRFFTSTDQLVTLRMFSGHEPRQLGPGAPPGSPDHDGVECGRAGIRSLLEREAAALRQHLQPLSGMARPGVAAGQGRRGHGERVSQVGRAVRAGRRRLGLSEGPRPRHRGRPQHRQRSVVRHRHVHRDAGGVQRAARDGDLSPGPRRGQGRAGSSACARCSSPPRSAAPPAPACSTNVER